MNCLESAIRNENKIKSVFSPCLPCTNTKRQLEAQLPIPFELHYKYPVKVMADLQNGMITGKGKTKFVASVAAAIFQYKSYPNQTEI